MDLTLKQLEDLYHADNETKADFVRLHMPWCQSEDEFYKTLEQAIKSQQRLNKIGSANQT